MVKKNSSKKEEEEEESQLPRQKKLPYASNFFSFFNNYTTFATVTVTSAF